MTLEDIRDFNFILIRYGWTYEYLLRVKNEKYEVLYEMTKKTRKISESEEVRHKWSEDALKLSTLVQGFKEFPDELLL